MILCFFVFLMLFQIFTLWIYRGPLPAFLRLVTPFYTNRPKYTQIPSTERVQAASFPFSLASAPKYSLEKAEMSQLTVFSCLKNWNSSKIRCQKEWKSSRVFFQFTKHVLWPSTGHSTLRMTSPRDFRCSSLRFRTSTPPKTVSLNHAPREIAPLGWEQIMLLLSKKMYETRKPRQSQAVAPEIRLVINLVPTLSIHLQKSPVDPDLEHIEPVLVQQMDQLRKPTIKNRFVTFPPRVSRAGSVHPCSPRFAFLSEREKKKATPTSLEHSNSTIRVLFRVSVAPAKTLFSLPTLAMKINKHSLGNGTFSVDLQYVDALLKYQRLHLAIQRRVAVNSSRLVRPKDKIVQCRCEHGCFGWKLERNLKLRIMEGRPLRFDFIFTHEHVGQCRLVWNSKFRNSDIFAQKWVDSRFVTMWHHSRAELLVRTRVRFEHQYCTPFQVPRRAQQVQPCLDFLANIWTHIDNRDARPALINERLLVLENAWDCEVLKVTRHLPMKNDPHIFSLLEIRYFQCFLFAKIQKRGIEEAIAYFSAIVHEYVVPYVTQKSTQRFFSVKKGNTLLSTSWAIRYYCFLWEDSLMVFFSGKGGIIFHVVKTDSGIRHIKIESFQKKKQKLLWTTKKTPEKCSSLLDRGYTLQLRHQPKLQKWLRLASRSPFRNPHLQFHKPLSSPKYWEAKKSLSCSDKEKGQKKISKNHFR